MKQSEKRSLNSVDYERIAKNAGIFFIPVITIVLGLFIKGETNPQIYAVAVAVWLQGVLIDIYRKWAAGEK